ncbi:MAG: hypothetical protein ABF614_00790 [Bifidobacterium psychraerophilum]
MSFMDSSSFAALVARNVSSVITRSGTSVLRASQLTGIPRVTLIRRLRFPSTSPFDVHELEMLAQAFHVNVETLVTPNEETDAQVPVARHEGERGGHE